MGFKLIVTHTPTGKSKEYGPWPSNPDPEILRANLYFAQGFVLGTEAVMRGEEYDGNEYVFQAEDVPDQGDSVAVGVVPTASGSVTHADGTVD